MQRRPVLIAEDPLKDRIILYPVQIRSIFADLTRAIVRHEALDVDLLVVIGAASLIDPQRCADQQGGKLLDGLSERAHERSTSAIIWFLNWAWAALRCWLI